MAQARKVVGDQNSAEFEQVRNTLNTILLMLEAAGAAIVAGDTAEDVLQTIGEAITAGTDSSAAPTAANYAPTEREVVGLVVTPQHPTRPGFATGTNLVDL